jgi:hypothetical protein
MVGRKRGLTSASVRGAESPFPCEPRGCVNFADVSGLVTSVNQYAVKNRRTSWFIPESEFNGAFPRYHRPALERFALRRASARL